MLESPRGSAIENLSKRYLNHVVLFDSSKEGSRSYSLESGVLVGRWPVGGWECYVGGGGRERSGREPPRRGVRAGIWLSGEVRRSWRAGPCDDFTRDKLSTAA